MTNEKENMALKHQFELKGILGDEGDDAIQTGSSLHQHSMAIIEQRRRKMGRQLKRLLFVSREERWLRS